MLSSVIRNITAKLKATYDYSSLQINLPEDLSDAVIDWGKKNIPEDTLHNNGNDTKGREDDIHTTLFYGIKSPDVNAVKKFITVKPFIIRMGLITAFMDNDYDVLKIEASAPELYKLHYNVRNNVENENKFPTYSPHITIAYLKKGNALKWVGDKVFDGKEFNVNEIIFSSSNGNRIPIKF